MRWLLAIVFMKFVEGGTEVPTGLAVRPNDHVAEPEMAHRKAILLHRAK